MLDDAGTDAFKDLFMLLELLVQVFDSNLIGTNHLLIDIGQTEATFLERHFIPECFDKFSIDENLFEILGGWIIGVERIAIDGWIC